MNRFQVAKVMLLQALQAPAAFVSGWRFATRLDARPGLPPHDPATTGNDLERYFDSVSEGPGIWKWRYYFDIYDRHLSRFRGRAPTIVEIGVFSGGSLDMWRSYFGDEATIHGVDIEPACRAYARPGVEIHIGDQADPGFWRDFVEKVGEIDVVIDDGGHRANQQIATFEGLFPHMRPGGVYICEDIEGSLHGFQFYLDGLMRPVNELAATSADIEAQLVRAVPTPVHQQIASIHRYPMVAVIEKPLELPALDGERHGSEWQPFYQRPARA